MTLRPSQLALVLGGLTVAIVGVIVLTVLAFARTSRALSELRQESSTLVAAERAASGSCYRLNLVRIVQHNNALIDYRRDLRAGAQSAAGALRYIPRTDCPRAVHGELNGPPQPVRFDQGSAPWPIPPVSDKTYGQVGIADDGGVG